MALIIDVETTGLPNSRYLDYTYLENFEQARIVQFTMMLCDKNYNVVELKDYIIKAKGFKIENTEFHGITDEISEKEGIEFEEIAKIFSEYLHKVTKVVAHNLNFDANIIKSELYRLNLIDIISEFEEKKQICTMLKTKSLLNLQTKYGIKYPSLAELYEFVFKEPLTNAHNSKYDVINLQKVVKQLHDQQKLF